MTRMTYVQCDVPILRRAPSVMSLESSLNLNVEKVIMVHQQVAAGVLRRMVVTDKIRSNAKCVPVPI